MRASQFLTVLGAAQLIVSRKCFTMVEQRVDNSEFIYQVRALLSDRFLPV